MPLTTCPKCNATVSDRAITCPQCGHTMGEEIAPVSNTETTPVDTLNNPPVEGQNTQNENEETVFFQDKIGNTHCTITSKMWMLEKTSWFSDDKKTIIIPIRSISCIMPSRSNLWVAFVVAASLLTIYCGENDMYNPNTIALIVILFVIALILWFVSFRIKVQTNSLKSFVIKNVSSSDYRIIIKFMQQSLRTIK